TTGTAPAPKPVQVSTPRLAGQNQDIKSGQQPPDQQTPGPQPSARQSAGQQARDSKSVPPGQDVKPAPAPEPKPAVAKPPAPAPAQRKTGINENYARELLELHTLGVDGGYTQKDVQEVARCLTGWTIDRLNESPSFVFRPWMHDTGAKTV